MRSFALKIVSICMQGNVLLSFSLFTYLLTYFIYIHIYLLYSHPPSLPPSLPSMTYLLSLFYLLTYITYLTYLLTININSYLAHSVAISDILSLKHKVNPNNIRCLIICDRTWEKGPIGVVDHYLFFHTF